MKNEKMYSADEICKELNITIYTLGNWYRWEKRLIKEGLEEPYLPQPIKIEHTKGKPRMWTESMLEKLKEYQKSIITGRNGIYGEFSNPLYKETKKYKKSIGVIENK